MKRRTSKTVAEVICYCLLALCVMSPVIIAMGVCVWGYSKEGPAFFSRTIPAIAPLAVRVR